MQYFVSQLLNGLSLGCVYALIALGFSMVYGVLKQLNFAHSEVFTAGTLVAWLTTSELANRFPGSPWLILMLAIPAAACASAILAFVLELIAYRPLRDEPKITVLLTAIGMSIVLQNVGIATLGAQTRGFPDVGLSISPKLFAVLVLGTAFGFLRVLIYKSTFGIGMRAVAEDREIAQLMGLRPNRYIAAAFAIGGAFAGLAGVVWGMSYGTFHPQMGFVPGIKSFIVAVVGGIGSLQGTFLCGVALGVFECLVAGYIPSEFSGFRDGVVLTCLTMFLVVKPGGLFGQAGPPKV